MLKLFEIENQNDIIKTLENLMIISYEISN